jgi:hypothetical protein
MEIPAGWYPDPAGDTTKIRYWNGQAWTDQTQPVVNPELVNNAGGFAPAPAPGPAPAPAPAPGQPAAAPLQPIYAPSQEIPPYAMAAPTADRKGFAIAGFVLGIVGILFCCMAYFACLPALLGIIFSALGLKSSRRGLAIAGIIIGAVAVLLGIGMTILAVEVLQHPEYYGFDSDYFDLYNSMTF